jgi:hypothetical protein
MYAMENSPYLRPIKREIIVRITLKAIDRMMDVARGSMQVIFFPWNTKSPGNLPRGIFIREAR